MMANYFDFNSSNSAYKKEATLHNASNFRGSWISTTFPEVRDNGNTEASCCLTCVQDPIIEEKERKKQTNKSKYTHKSTKRKIY